MDFDLIQGFMLDVICATIGSMVLVLALLCKCLKGYLNGFVQSVNGLKIQKFYIVFVKNHTMTRSKHL